MGRPRVARLDRERIAAAALEMVDRDGDFTMPTLAKKLDVQVSSIYHHVPDGRVGVVELIRLRATNRIDASAFDDQPWDEAVRVWAQSFLDAFRAHPAAIRLLATEPVRDASLVGVYDGISRSLRQAGVQDCEVYSLIVAMENFLLGCAFDLIAPDTVVPAEVDGEQHPDLAAVVTSAPPGTERAQQSYRLGLEMFIEGIRGRLGS